LEALDKFILALPKLQPFGHWITIEWPDSSLDTTTVCSSATTVINEELGLRSIIAISDVGLN
jgi:hypothetical protein